MWKNAKHMFPPLLILNYLSSRGKNYHRCQFLFFFEIDIFHVIPCNSWNLVSFFAFFLCIFYILWFLHLLGQSLLIFAHFLIAIFSDARLAHFPPGLEQNVVFFWKREPCAYACNLTRSARWCGVSLMLWSPASAATATATAATKGPFVLETRCQKDAFPYTRLGGGLRGKHPQFKLSWGASAAYFRAVRLISSRSRTPASWRRQTSSARGTRRNRCDVPWRWPGHPAVDGFCSMKHRVSCLLFLISPISPNHVCIFILPSPSRFWLCACLRQFITVKNLPNK